MTPARLFNVRYRGFRVVDIVSLSVLSVLVLGVYGTKALAGREGAKIADIEQQIGEEQRQVRLLKAELAHLEQPGRLVRLSTDYLGLQPLSAKRESPPDGLTQIAFQAAQPVKTSGKSPAPAAAKPASPPAVAAAASAPTPAAPAASPISSTPAAGSVVQ